MTDLIVQLVLGAIGGNLGGALMKNLSLGPVGNSIAGIIGGGLGGQILNAVLGSGAGGGMVGDVAGGALRRPRAARCAAVRGGLRR